MLTAAQCATVAWIVEDVGYVCLSCADNGAVDGFKVSRLIEYSADEIAAEMKESLLCDVCGATIAEWEN